LCQDVYICVHTFVIYTYYRERGREQERERQERESEREREREGVKGRTYAREREGSRTCGRE